MILRHSNGQDFSTGRAKYHDSDNSSQGVTAKIYVKITFASFGCPILALLDTGAAWSILDAEIAEALDLFDDAGEIVPISTRKGSYQFRLKRVNLEILADHGTSLSFEATVAVQRDWKHGTFIGYQGLLERMKFAVDPFDNFFYFGTHTPPST